MNWEAIGAIAESIGVIAIFVSLVYVAIQIRQNTQQFKRSIEATGLAAFERNIESGNHIRELLILNPDLAQLLLKGFRSFVKLDASEKFRFGLLLRNLFSGIQGGFVRQLAVDHDPTGFDGPTQLVDEILQNLGARQWLNQTDPDWRPVFRDFVNERLAKIESAAEKPGEAEIGKS